MSADRPGWPALQGYDPRVGHRLCFTQAIWGKAQAVATDFRWLAASEGFEISPDLAAALNLGAEDQPLGAVHWRFFRDRYYAVRTYPSRAIDAFGRRGFVEKQVLAWTPDGSLPPAAAALVLLPLAATLDDRLWWETRERPAWSNREYRLRIPPTRNGRVEVYGARVQAAIEAAAESLRGDLGRVVLVDAYQRVAGGASNAVLKATAPPTPAAVAALLLPLPRALADRTSIAGWVPTSRPRWDDLATRWGFLVSDRTPGVQAGMGPGVPAPGDPIAAMVDDLLDGEARVLVPVPEGSAPRVLADGRRDAELPGGPPDPRLPPVALDLPPLPDEAPECMRRLFGFAAAVQARWIEPVDLPMRLGADAGDMASVRAALGAHAQTLVAWVETLSGACPQGVDPEHWAFKVDVLRAIVLAGISDPAAVERLGLPRDDRVPALLYFPVMVPPGLLGTAAPWIGEVLPGLIERGLCCPDTAIRAAIAAWVAEYRRGGEVSALSRGTG